MTKKVHRALQLHVQWLAYAGGCRRASVVLSVLLTSVEEYRMTNTPPPTVARPKLLNTAALKLQATIMAEDRVRAGVGDTASPQDMYKPARIIPATFAANYNNSS